MFPTGFYVCAWDEDDPKLTQIRTKMMHGQSPGYLNQINIIIIISEIEMPHLV